MAHKIKTIIIEDDLTASEYLSTILSTNFSIIEIVEKANNIVSSIDLINKIKPELVFMDIELIDGLSFEIFDQIEYHDFEVIFVTAHDDFIKKAIKHYAFSFILKPFEPKNIIDAVNRYVKLKERMFSLNKYQTFHSFLKNKDAHFLIHTGNKHVSIKVCDIIKCIAEGNYTYFYLNNNVKYLASHSLKYYESLLNSKGFFKAHRSILINIDYIESIYKKETIILKNDDKIHVSTRNKSNLIHLINSMS